jgi:uncharacterized protein with HEPN domain
MRKHLIEEYYLVDPVEVYTVARNDIPHFREPLERPRAALDAE